jgi:hypothetical protein
VAQIPGAWVETLKNPSKYTPHQLDKAIRLASILNRGRFILTETPQR